MAQARQPRTEGEKALFSIRKPVNRDFDIINKMELPKHLEEKTYNPETGEPTVTLMRNPYWEPAFHLIATGGLDDMANFPDRDTASRKADDLAGRLATKMGIQVRREPDDLSVGWDFRYTRTAG
jgi:hypothetical protein